jgi:serine/threonine protein kinase
MLRQLSHPNVVSLKEVIRDATHVYIVQECLTGGELFDRLLAKGPFKEDYALTIFAQVGRTAAAHKPSGRRLPHPYRLRVHVFRSFTPP